MGAYGASVRLRRSLSTSRVTPPRVAALSAAVLAIVLITGLGLGAHSAYASSWKLPRGVRKAHVVADGRLVDPQATCDVPQPQDQYITFPSFAQTNQEICGIWSLEDEAEASYDALHGYPDGDSRAVDTGLPQEAGYVESLLESLAYAKSTSSQNLDSDEAGAEAWFLAVDQQYQITVAQDALNEYNKWVREQCSYLPPSTQAFDYRPKDQSVCEKSTSLANLYTALTPPSEADFISYGTYEADQSFDINGALGAPSDQLLIDQGITEGAGAFATILAGAAPQALAQVDSLSEGYMAFLKSVVSKANGDPGVQIFNYKAEISKWRAANAEQADAIDEVNELETAGFDEDEIDPELLETAATAEEEMAADAGVSDALTEAVGAAADDMSGEFAVAAVALTIAVTEGEAVVTAADIPKQLESNLSQAEHPANLNGYVWGQLTGGSEGAVSTLTNVEGQMQFPQTTIGNEQTLSCGSCLIYKAPPSVGSPPAQLQLTALNSAGTPTGWSSTATTAPNIDTWPMGAADGESGVPEINVAIANGEVWTSDMAGSAPTDESEAGLSGYLPSGELHYFNAAGQPMIAYLDGDQFETLSNPGSIDAGGADAGDACATAGECTLSSSIVVMADGGTPQLQDNLEPGTFLGMTCTANDGNSRDCLTDTLLPDGDLVPADGSTLATTSGNTQQQGTSQLYRLTLEPDAGTPAATWVANKYNTSANDLGGGAPNGGLIAGQNVTFTDPDVSPSGYSTTYSWQIQAVCPYVSGQAPRTIQGVPVCSGSPDYGSTTGLAADEQDLTSCQDPVAGTVCSPAAVLGWNEDPEFRGGPVSTLTGQSVNWTWPAPGTYHVRLVTTDQYGVSVTSDQDLVVSASSSPTSTFSWSAASGTQPGPVAPSVVGPVTDGDAVTLTGCVNSPDTIGSSAYSTPAVTVDWGDGSAADSGTAGSSSDPDLVFTFDPASGCSTPWEYQATHTYSMNTAGQPFIQVPIKVTVADVTDPVTPPSALPAGTSTSSSTTVYANVYSSSAPPSFVSGSSTSFDFQAGDSQTVTGYVTSASDATITHASAGSVTQNGATCTAGLPSGMGFTATDDNSFTIEGTPSVSAGGCYAIDVTAANGDGSAIQQVIVEVAQVPSFTSATSVGWATGSTGSFTVDTTGFPAPALTVTSVNCTTGCGSALPSDIRFVDNGNGTATLSSGGADISDDDSGVYDITLSASGSSGRATQSFTLTIGGPPAFSSPASAGFTTEEDGTFDINASGSPTVSNITCTITIDSATNPCVSTTTGDSLIDSNYAGDNAYGLYFRYLGDGTAMLLGAPYASGEYTVTLTATNSVGQTSQTLSILVSNTGGSQITMLEPEGGTLTSYTPPAGEAPAFGTANFVVGQAGSVTLCSDDSTDTMTSESQLPAGLTLTNGVTGTSCPAGDEAATISGTPSAALNANSTGSIADRILDTGSGLADLTIDLVDAGVSAGSPTFTSPSTAVFTVGTSGSFTASLGTLFHYDFEDNDGCFSESGALPDGLTFNPNAGGNEATVSGTPTTSGVSTVTLIGSDCEGDAPTQQVLTIVVRKAATITSADSASFQVGAGGTFTVTTNADAYPVPALGVVGALPPGVTFTDNGDGTGTLTVARDTPATSTAQPITFAASSAAGTSTQQLNLTVGVAPQITAPATNPTPVVMTEGDNGSYTVVASGEPTPTLTCSIGGAACSGANLPSGLTFTDNGNGTATVSGTPTALGTGDLTITAADGVGSAASTTLDLAVDTAAGFAGSTTSGSCASASASATQDTFVANASGVWTLCGAGSPAPSVSLRSVTCAGSPSNLPSGLTFTDNGDGSATLSGAPAQGSGASCPGGYSLTVAFANAASTAVETVTLKVQEVIVGTTPSPTAPMVPGVANQVVLGAAGSPVPSFATDPSTPLPSWLKLTSLGNGTAALRGTPPAAAAGTSVTFLVDVTNDDSKTLVEPITVPVSTIALEKATPPAASIGRAFSYQFKASTHASFSLASGSLLPLGLKLSGSGRLKGTPTELGRFAIAMKVTGAGQTVTTGEVVVTVKAATHALEITQFRTAGPKGQGDWFVQVVNTTHVSIPLTGWDIGIQQAGSKKPDLIPIGTGKLRPDGTAVLAGTAFSLRSKLPVHRFGATVVPLDSGFQIVAPNGAVVDAAGVRGAVRGLVAGRGVSYPRDLHRGQQGAFVRKGYASEGPVDTGDNARNFSFGTVVKHPKKPRKTARKPTKKPKKKPTKKKTKKSKKKKTKKPTKKHS